MLYKKYHRNYIRKFKKGTRFMEYIGGYYEKMTYEVVKEPFIEYGCFSVGIGMIDSKNYDRVVVVYHSGRINHNIKVIENAV